MSAGDWKNVRDVAAFLAKRGSIRTGAHKMTGKICNWPYCKNCGLIGLKNDVTRRALRAACVYEDD